MSIPKSNPEWKPVEFKTISAAHVGKQLFGEEAKSAKQTTVAGKLIQTVERLGRSALAIIYRIQSAVNGGEWLTKEVVMKKLTSDIALLSSIIQNNPKKIADGYNMYTLAINEMRAVCDAFRDHGIDTKELKSLESNLSTLEKEIDNAKDKAASWGPPPREKAGNKPQPSIKPQMPGPQAPNYAKDSGQLPDDAFGGKYNVTRTAPIKSEAQTELAKKAVAFRTQQKGNIPELINGTKDLIKLANAVKTPDGDLYLKYSLSHSLGDIGTALGQTEFAKLQRLEKGLNPKLSSEKVSNNISDIIKLIEKGFSQKVVVKEEGAVFGKGTWGGDISKFTDVQQAVKNLKEALKQIPK
jgi:hypothetical protein